MNIPEGFESQVIDTEIPDRVISLLIDSVRGPREAMAVIVAVIKKLNAEPFREGPIPSNKELVDEMLTMFNSFKRVDLQ